MDDSDLSSLASLSPPPPSDHEGPSGGFGLDGSHDAQRSSSPSPAPSSSSSDSKDRPASPPHEFVLADNPDIAFIVMFRSRFNEAFSTKLGHFGPQDIERGVTDPNPSPQVESLLCALLALVLNRKKPVERGHYGRALEEAILAQKSQWPRAWKGQNPLSGSRTFSSMDPTEKLTLLKTLIIWSLHSSEVVSNIIKESYKQSRSELDLNQPLAVQPWGADGKKHIYWLIEGQDDTSFRIYTEKNHTKVNNEWISVAGSIEEMQALAQKLREEDRAQAARRLADRIERSVPRFEATEEKRKRREYRVARRAQFTRPEPGFSLYEGRTRGKRMRYTFEEEDDEYTSDALSTRRSARQSGAATPSEPTVTASGRHVKPRVGGRYGEIGVDGVDSADHDTPASAEYERSDKSEEPAPPIDANVKYYKPKGRGWKGWAIAEDKGEGSGAIHGYNAVDAMDEDEDEAMSSGESGGEWDGGDDESDVIRARDADDEDDDMDDAGSDDDDTDAQQRSLVVTLKYRKQDSSWVLNPVPPPPKEMMPANMGRDTPQQSTMAAQESNFSHVKPEEPLPAPMPEVPATYNNLPTLPSGEDPTTNAAAQQMKSVLASHPSPHKTAAVPMTVDTPLIAPFGAPVAPSAVGEASNFPQQPNGLAAVPPQYRQQTLDGLFTRPSSTIGADSGKSPLPTIPPVTST